MVTDYDWLSLDGGEEIVWTGKPRTRSVLGSVAGAIGFVLVSLAALGAAATLTDIPRWMLLLAGVGVVLYGAIQVVRAYVPVANTDYVLTTRNLYKKRGVLSETVNRVGVEKIQRTTLSKGVLGNLFDYGTVDVSTAGGRGVEMRIKDLNDPGELRENLRRRISAASSRTDPDAVGESRVDPETAQQVIEEARRMREAAIGIEEAVRR